MVVVLDLRKPRDHEEVDLEETGFYFGKNRDSCNLIATCQYHS